MNYMAFAYRWNPRELRKIILTILKSWMADNVKKINYVQNYVLQENWVDKIEEKILLIHSEKQDDLLNFLSKNFPQIKRIYVN